MNDIIKIPFILFLKLSSILENPSLAQGGGGAGELHRGQRDPLTDLNTVSIYTGVRAHLSMPIVKFRQRTLLFIVCVRYFILA